jgi:hypothetical protein
MAAGTKNSRLGDYFLLWFFAIAAFIGLVAASDIVWRSAEPVKVSRAPTVQEYRQAAVAVMNPFLGRSMALIGVEFDFSDTQLLSLATEVRDGLLELRVPGSEKDAHLALVLMLDRWILALDGDAASREAAVTQLRAALDTYPWVRPASASPL